jgi:hypothetical protein
MTSKPSSTVFNNFRPLEFHLYVMPDDDDGGSGPKRVRMINKMGSLLTPVHVYKDSAVTDVHGESWTSFEVF